MVVLQEKLSWGLAKFHSVERLNVCTKRCGYPSNNYIQKFQLDQNGGPSSRQAKAYLHTCVKKQRRKASVQISFGTFL